MSMPDRIWAWRNSSWTPKWTELQEEAPQRVQADGLYIKVSRVVEMLKALSYYDLNDFDGLAAEVIALIGRLEQAE